MIKLFYIDNHVMVVEKPAMMPVQADSSGDANLLDILKMYVKKRYNKAGNVYLGLVHRLDRPVAGILVFARTSKAAARLQKSMKNDEWIKSYIAVLTGRLAGSGEWEDYIARDGATGYISACNDKNAKLAKLSYASHEIIEDATLAKIQLVTGRHHQIRVQAELRGHAVWGDARYNRTAKPGQPIALYADFLSFPHPTQDLRLSFSSLPNTLSKPWDSFNLSDFQISDYEEI